MRRAVVLAITLLVAACGADPYPLPSGPAQAGQRNPATVGRPTSGVLLFIEVRPGDRIEFLGAEAIGSLAGSSVRFLLSRPVVAPTGERVIGEAFEELGGAVVTAVTDAPGPDNTVGIAIELTPAQPGRFEITDIRLRYRLNGSEERTGQGIDVTWIVCADDPAPADCPEGGSESPPG